MPPKPVPRPARTPSPAPHVPEKREKLYQVANNQWILSSRYSVPISSTLPNASAKTLVQAESATQPQTPLPATALPGPGRGHRLTGRNALIPLFFAVALILWLYHAIAFKLVRDWYELPDFSHGFLIPFFVLFLLWVERDKLQSTPLAPTWAGLPLVLFALLTLLTGVFGADLFLSRTSFLLLLAGIIWTIFGLPMLNATKFMLLVLILAIPLPTVIFNQLTFPLQLLASRLASDLLPLFGVPVLREGNVIQLPAMQLEVAEACSGIRSMMSLFTVAVIYGYFLERTTLRRTVLALASIPIAVAANALRIFGTGLCVQYWNPDKAVGFFHEFSGWLMFLVSLSCLYLIHLAMRLIPPPKKASL